MQKFNLKKGTVDILKTLDSQLETASKEIKEAVDKFNNVVKYVNSQKSLVVSTVLKELEVDPDTQFKLNEDYTIEEVSKEDFEALSKNPGNMQIDTAEVAS